MRRSVHARAIEAPASPGLEGCPDTSNAFVIFAFFVVNRFSQVGSG